MNNLIKKGIAVAVIFLFMGLAFAPSINANVSKASQEDEMVEITTEVCGLKGGRQTVRFTKAEAEEVEQLIDDIKRRLDEVGTREEAVEIFNEAVVELDKYGLLGGLSVKQAQRLVTGGYNNPKIIEIIERLVNVYQGNGDSNFLCLVAGETNEFVFFTFPLWVPYPIIWYQLRWAFLFRSIFPYKIMADVYIGVKFVHEEYGANWIKYEPATGSLWTSGSNGVKEWSGKFYGCISKLQWSRKEGFGRTYHHMCRGIIGFKGIKFWNATYFNIFMGFSPYVSISYEYPFD